MIEKRYGALRAIGTIYKILGIIVVVLSIIGLIVSCLALVVQQATLTAVQRELEQLGGFAGPTAGLAVAGFGLLYGLMAGLALYAFGEAVFLFLAIEENTRATTMLLDRRLPNEPEAPGYERRL